MDNFIYSWIILFFEDIPDLGDIITVVGKKLYLPKTKKNKNQ